MSISINGISDKKTADLSAKEYFQMRDIFEFMTEDIFEISEPEDNKAPMLKTFYIDPQEMKKYFDNVGNLKDLKYLNDVYNKSADDDIFRSFDLALQQMKKDAEDYARYMKEYREMMEKKKRIQQQKALDNIDFMKKTGKLLISGLSPEAAQLVMSETPEMMSDFRMQEEYRQSIDENKYQIYEDREKFYDKKYEDLENLKEDMQI